MARRRVLTSRESTPGTIKGRPRMALDTSVAVLLFHNRPIASEQKRHGAIQAMLEGDEYDFVLPAPAVLELLAAVAPRDRQLLLDRLLNLEVADFGFRAALVSAELAAVPTAEERRKHGITWDKPRVKYDATIVGAAVAADVDAFCSFDENQRTKFARLAPGKAVGTPTAFLPDLLAKMYEE
jgi:predicted nucleic acid-binding protein